MVMPLRLDFAADFRDMFEVRGTTRSRRGRAYDAAVEDDSVAFRYDGLDDVTRQSVIAFSRRPTALADAAPNSSSRSAGAAARSLFIEVGCRAADAEPRSLPRRRGAGALRHARPSAAAAPPSTARAGCSTTG